MPRGRPLSSIRSFHSLIQEKRCRRRSLGLADRRRDGRRLQPVEGGLQPVVIEDRVAAPDEGEDFIGRPRHQARGGDPPVARFDDMRGGPNQDVGIPDGRHAMLGRRLDPDRHVAHAKVDGSDAG